MLTYIKADFKEKDFANELLQELMEMIFDLCENLRFYD